MVIADQVAVVVVVVMTFAVVPASVLVHGWAVPPVLPACAITNAPDLQGWVACVLRCSLPA